eukprot:173971_1
MARRALCWDFHQSYMFKFIPITGRSLFVNGLSIRSIQMLPHSAYIHTEHFINHINNNRMEYFKYKNKPQSNLWRKKYYYRNYLNNGIYGHILSKDIRSEKQMYVKYNYNPPLISDHRMKRLLFEYKNGIDKIGQFTMHYFKYLGYNRYNQYPKGLTSMVIPRIFGNNAMIHAKFKKANKRAARMRCTAIINKTGADLSSMNKRIINIWNQLIILINNCNDSETQAVNTFLMDLHFDFISKLRKRDKETFRKFKHHTQCRQRLKVLNIGSYFDPS